MCVSVQDSLGGSAPWPAQQQTMSVVPPQTGGQTMSVVPPQTGTGESIRVAVRVRPLNQREKDLASSVVVSMNDKTTTVLHGRNHKHFTYDFSYYSIDPSYPSFASQEEVFRDMGLKILSNAIDGFNSSIFAYGQTGSGKSYSVLGPPEDPGLIPRVVTKLFEDKERMEADPNKELQVWISYLEIYKEQVTDLLTENTSRSILQAQEQLKIMDHPKLGVYVRGLMEVPCETQKDVMNNLHYGIKKRAVAATNMNQLSSRSHAVFVIRVKSLEGPRPSRGDKDERKTLRAKINLIDLAGSERTGKAGTEHEQLKEGCQINQSLSALGMIIKALSELVGKSIQSVPFRMSKLTFLLKDSLAGNSRTFMMATISPANDNIDETLSTLRFASSVKAIKTVAIQNKDKKDELIDKLHEEMKLLRAQIAAGGFTTADAQEQFLERQLLSEELQKDFKEDLKLAKEMQQHREKALEENGLSQYHITQAFGIREGTPYFLNMADDPMLAGCLIYLIKEGEPTLMGSGKTNTITLKGVGIPEVLCRIENSDNTKVTISRICEAGRVVVNGKVLKPDEHRVLHHGDKVFLGRSHALKLVMPDDVGDANQVPAEELSLQGLEAEFAALDDSPSWVSLEMYVDQVLRQMSNRSAGTLLKEIKRACQFADEANELTQECRSEEPIHFEVDLTSSMPPCVVIRALFCPSGKDVEDEESWETKYVWSLAQLEERVDRMRDYCATWQKGLVTEVDVMQDPWHEVEPQEIAHRMRQLEGAAEEAYKVMNIQLRRSMRVMFALRPRGSTSNNSFTRIFFGFWKSVVQANISKGKARRSSSVGTRRASTNVNAVRKRAETPENARRRSRSFSNASKSPPKDASKRRSVSPQRQPVKNIDLDKAPEATPEVVHPETDWDSPSMQGSASFEISRLQEELCQSQEENATLKKQLDVAWELCAILRARVLGHGETASTGTDTQTHTSCSMPVVHSTVPVPSSSTACSNAPDPRLEVIRRASPVRHQPVTVTTTVPILHPPSPGLAATASPPSALLFAPGAGFDSPLAGDSRRGYQALLQSPPLPSGFPVEPIARSFPGGVASHSSSRLMGTSPASSHALVSSAAQSPSARTSPPSDATLLLGCADVSEQRSWSRVPTTGSRMISAPVGRSLGNAASYCGVPTAMAFATPPVPGSVVSSLGASRVSSPRSCPRRVTKEVQAVTTERKCALHYLAEPVAVAGRSPSAPPARTFGSAFSGPC